MPPTHSSRFHPKRWTALTWAALAFWAWEPVVLNYPPSVTYEVDEITGELSSPTHYESLAELDVPVGWPFHYVRPSYLSAVPGPVAPGGYVTPGHQASAAWRNAPSYMPRL